MLETVFFKSFLEVHRQQLLNSNVPERFWPALCRKISEEIFDAGSKFIFAPREEGVGRPRCTVHVEFVRRDDSDSIYLIDHAWTFTYDNLTNCLTTLPGLLERMSALIGVEDENDPDRLELVKKHIWKFAQTYSLGGPSLTVESRTPFWYVMDEFGSYIEHSDSPNFRTVPFIYVPTQTTYSLLYPIRDIFYGDLVTRDFAEGALGNPSARSLLLIPWYPDGFQSVDFAQKEPDPDYFLGGHAVETLPDPNNSNCITKKPVFKVFSEYSLINDSLTNERFQIVSDESEADIVWKLTHFKDFKEFSETAPQKFINQFPFEYVLNIKDLFAVVCRRNETRSYDERSLDTFPKWLPTTFNLKTELDLFVSYYRRRAALGLDNCWICKPFNLARSIDTNISNNLDFLVRLPLTGPKIAQKYVENPVLFERPDCGLVKFDVRYVVLLKSARNPTRVYVYRNFFLRFANAPFALDRFDEYERHFTVMNYARGAPLYALKCAEFKDEWRRQRPGARWDDVENDVFEMLRTVFANATSKLPPLGIAESPQSRALYAVDLILSWDAANAVTGMQPKILEVNWMPDCERATQYYPDFYNDVFSCLFLDTDVDSCVKIL